MLPNPTKSLMFFILFMTGSLGYCTHIVGGDFYYKKEGDYTYQVTLKLYIDCYNGNTAAIANDEIAIVSLWEASTKKLIRLENFTRTSPTRLSKVNYKCLKPPQDVCVDEYVYTKTLTLDPGENGVILSFQRCCRNNTISNLIDPKATGATYWVKIPGTNVTQYNNSAVFKELPPNYICTKAPLKFDHSAVDPDGDSLVYQLYQPYHGASYDDPRPDNTGQNGMLKAPPYNTIYWRNPYNTNDQMGGDPIMMIDARTGELTVTPTTVGQFVIGIKVLEYRNGVLIGETLRDYQMNVKECDFDLIAAFAAPTYSCKDTVKFTNKSYKAAHYRWDFGDPSTKADTSNETHPTYIYPKDGDYYVTLYAWNTICNDEFTFLVKVRSNIKFDLGPDYIFCDKVDALLVVRLWDAPKIAWSNGKYGNTLRVTEPGKYSVTVYYGSCIAKDSIELGYDPVEFKMIPDTLFCEKKDVNFVADVGTSGLHYRWSTHPYDTFQTKLIKDTGHYWVRVKNKNCQKTSEFRVYLPTKPVIGPYFFVCNEFNKDLDAGGVDGSTYLWNDGSTDRIKNISSEGKYWVRVTEKYCINSDTLVVENPIIQLDLGLDKHFCDELYCIIKAPPFMKNYTWQDGSKEQNFITTQPGKFYVACEDTNGCFKSDTLILTQSASPIIQLGDDTAVCARSSLKLGVSDKYKKYEWSDGSINNTIEVTGPGLYTLKVTDAFGCTGYDEVMVRLDINALPNELFIPNAFTPNADGLNEVFPYAELIIQPEYRVRVFNRWGQKVFDSELSHGQSWDATFEGRKVPLEAFVYMVDYRGCDGQKRHVSGTVTVME